MNVSTFIGMGVLLALAVGVDTHVKTGQGYCFTEGRYHTEGEITEIAVLSLLEKLDVEGSGLSSTQREVKFFYSGIDDYFVHHPTCCNGLKRSDNSLAKSPRHVRFEYYAFTRSLTYLTGPKEAKVRRQVAVSVRPCSRKAGFAYDYEIKP